MLTRDQIMGSWKSVVGAVKEKYGEFTNDELRRVEGNIDQLIGLIQQKTGQGKEQVQAFVNDAMGNAGTVATRAMNAASEYSDVAIDAIRNGYDKVSTEAQRGAECTMNSIKSKPFESVAIAAGAGLVAGILVGLSMSSRR